MSVLVLAARLLLAVTFAIAGVTKLANQDDAREALVSFGVFAKLARPAALFLPFVELLVAGFMVFRVSALLGAFGALALLAVFTTAIGWNLAKGRRPDCHCFGQLQTAKIGWPTLGRNGVLLAAAGLVVWQGMSHDFLSVSGAMNALPLGSGAYGSFLGLLVVGLAAQGSVLYQVIRQHGRILIRLDGMEAALRRHGMLTALPEKQPGLPVGSPAPSFELASMSGEAVSLERLRENKKPVLLIFSDPHCRACHELLPDIAMWQREHESRLTVAVITSDDATSRRQEAAQKLANVLIQRDRHVSALFDVTATPSGVLVRDDGSIGSSVAIGVAAIGRLVASVVEGRVVDTLVPIGVRELQRVPTQDPPRPRVGSQVGQNAPSFRLPDLDGNMVEVGNFKGRSTMLVFWNPSCGFCSRMLPDLREWERRRIETSPALVLISTGDLNANRAMQLKAKILIDGSFAVARSFGATGTPSAVMIDSGGHLASSVAVGAGQIFALGATTETVSTG